MYANQSQKPTVFGCPFCHTVKDITQAVDVDFAMQEPQWLTIQKDGPPDFWRRTKTPMLICKDCTP